MDSASRGAGGAPGRSQVDVVLLPDPLSHQLAFADAQGLAAHHLTPPVLVHLHGEGGVHDTIPTQHLTCTRHLTHSYQLTSTDQKRCDSFTLGVVADSKCSDMDFPALESMLTSFIRTSHDSPRFSPL